MTTDETPSADVIAAGVAATQQYSDLRTLAGVLAKDDTATAVFIKGVVVSVQTVSSQVTCTVQLGGDTTTSIAGVRVLDSYSPVAGDVVQIGKQGAEIFIIGQINNTTPQANAANGWVTPSLGSGFSQSSDPVKYRVIVDNGDRKIQMRGSCAVSGSPAALWTMPSDLRPSVSTAMTISRDIGGGSAVAQLVVNSGGTVVLNGGTTGVRGTVTVADGGFSGSVGSGGGTGNRNTSGPTTIVNSGDTSHTHLYYQEAHTHAISTGDHTHPLSQVTHPTILYFTGIEYFL